MAAPQTVAELDLSPPAGKKYFNSTREWREEFIYFVMIDRFHDDAAHAPTLDSARSSGTPSPNNFYGGTIKGIKDHLDYIAGLGCTAVWLSPVFENNDGAYHGYNINNYLDIDPHFGTKQDLIDLVDAAHFRNPPMRIVLDVVINHSGDNWYCRGNVPYYYFNDLQFQFGDWRRLDRPIPTELQHESLYHRRGEMRDYDNYPENQQATCPA
jgi:glycosidase